MTADLAMRLLAVEDELAVRNVVAKYGMAVDCGDTAAAVACHSNDARYIVSAPRSGRETDGAVAEDLVLEGAAAIAAMLESDLHQSMLPNCAHTVGPLQVAINGESATVKGYSRIYLNESDAFRLLRVAVNRWELNKSQGTWLIQLRESRLLGEEAAQRLLKAGI